MTSDGSAIDDALLEATCDRLARLLGAELRARREALGLTRQQLIAQMSTEVHVQTIASYENGIRAVTVARLLDLCQAMGVHAGDLLTLCLQRVATELYNGRLLVDLSALVRDRNAAFDEVQAWARLRLAGQAKGVTVARLEAAAVREMAVIFSVPLPDLIAYLVTFAPDFTPDSGA